MSELMFYVISCSKKNVNTPKAKFSWLEKLDKLGKLWGHQQESLQSTVGSPWQFEQSIAIIID